MFVTTNALVTSEEAFVTADALATATATFASVEAVFVPKEAFAPVEGFVTTPVKIVTRPAEPFETASVLPQRAFRSTHPSGTAVFARLTSGGDAAAAAVVARAVGTVAAGDGAERLPRLPDLMETTHECQEMVVLRGRPDPLL